MEQALVNKPPTPFRVPSGVRLVRVDADSGLLPGPTTESVILEAFLPGTEPVAVTPQNDDIYENGTTTTGITAGRGGDGLGRAQDQRPAAPRAGGLY
jgi:penicillin-binding protein 1A